MVHCGLIESCAMECRHRAASKSANSPLRGEPSQSPHQKLCVNRQSWLAFRRLPVTTTDRLTLHSRHHSAVASGDSSDSASSRPQMSPRVASVIGRVKWRLHRAHQSSDMPSATQSTLQLAHGRTQCNPVADEATAHFSLVILLKQTSVAVAQHGERPMTNTTIADFRWRQSCRYWLRYSRYTLQLVCE